MANHARPPRSPVHRPSSASASAPVSAQTFLSYSHADHAAADELRDQLVQAGVGVFQDATHLRSGDRWLQRLQQALAECTALVVLEHANAGLHELVAQLIRRRLVSVAVAEESQG